MVRCVLYALYGFAAPGGRCCLAPVRISWLWPAGCLSGVPHRPAWCAAPRSVRSPSVLRSVFLTPGAFAPGLTGRRRGARGGRLRTEPNVPAAGPRQGGGAGLALCCTRLGPRDGVVPGGSPQASVLGCVRCCGWRVWTRSLRLLVSGTVLPLTGDWAGAPGLFRVNPDTLSCGSEDATPGSGVCARVLVLPGRFGRAGLL